MELTFIKNIQFTRLIKINGKLKEFNFRKPNSKQEGLFTVDVINENGTRIIFKMELLENKWKITDNELPAWILEKETIFHDSIEEGFKIR
jgi:hypothetical protein